MCDRYCAIESRFGDRDITTLPSDDEIRDAVIEVLNEALVLTTYPDLTEEDLQEHPNAWMRSHAEAQETWLLDLYRRGWLVLTIYSDGDLSEELYTSKLSNVTVEQAIHLWTSLRDCRFQELRAAFS